MGDAILCTPALRSLREKFDSCRITFSANSLVRELLSPGRFNDGWLQQYGKSPLATASKVKKYRFTHAILFKNSFASALVVFLAGIPSRIGYAREARGLLLTDRLVPPKLPDGRFKPLSMIDYYLAIPSVLGGITSDRTLDLPIDVQASESLRAKLPELVSAAGPIVIFVPGGAFGPSKCWSGKKFAQTADWLAANYNAIVVISVSPDPVEKKIAAEICDSSRCGLINLADRAISISELKVLFSRAELIISNDTGPRHIAIALKRKVVTIFGPNNPTWTETGYENEIKIVGQAPCAPCHRPICRKPEHFCMQSISAEVVCNAAAELLSK